MKNPWTKIELIAEIYKKNAKIAEDYQRHLKEGHQRHE